MQSVERHFLPPSTSGRCNLNLFLKRVPIADGKKKKNRTGHTILDASFPPTFLSELKNRKEKRKFSNGTRQMASKKKKFPFFFSLLPFFPSSSNLFWYFPLPTTKSWDQLVKWTHLCCWFVWTSPLRGFYFSDVFGKLFGKKKSWAGGVDHQSVSPAKVTVSHRDRPERERDRPYNNNKKCIKLDASLKIWAIERVV